MTRPEVHARFRRLVARAIRRADAERRNDGLRYTRAGHVPARATLVRVQLAIRAMMSTRWGDQWPAVKRELGKALHLRRVLHRAPWRN